MHNCQCDQQLGFMLGNFYESQINLNYVTNQDGSGFDYKNECKTSSNTGADGAGVQANGDVIGTPLGLSDWGFGCCGTYPYREPFKTNRNSCCPTGFFDQLSPLGAC